MSSEIKLRNYQTRAVDFIRQRKVCYISAYMGGGKSLCSLIETREYDTVLIICPAILLTMWRDEILKWYPDSSIKLVTKISQLISNKDKYIIISYDRALIQHYFDSLMLLDYQAVIIDEGHKLKNHKSKRSKAVFGFKQIGLATKPFLDKVIMLSGTPAQRPVELYAPLLGLRPDLLGQYIKYENFCFYFCSGYYNEYYQMIATGANHLDELANRVKDFMYFIPKAEVEAELPPITQSLIRFDISKSLVAQELKEFNAHNLIRTEASLAIATLSKIQHAMALDKVDLAANYILELFDNNESIVVFCWHTDVIEKICARLTLSISNVSVIQGSTTLTGREQTIKKFQNSEEPQVIICQIKTASEGISLTKAHHVVFVEFSWNPSDLEQCYKRVHRPGVTHPIIVHYLVTSNSLDDYKLKVILKKQKVIKTFSDLVQKDVDTSFIS